MKNHFFKTFAFEFETTRLLWYVPFGGADYGEVVTTTEKIKDGDYESWYNEWSAVATKLEKRANSFKLKSIKIACYLRASRYYQAAEFFLPPSDKRKVDVYEKSVNLFYQALDMKQIDYIIEKVTYKNAEMRTLFFKTSGKSKRTLFICGGFDALLEELYFTNAQFGLENDYDVVMYEGPGQSDMIRKHNLPFEENWHEASRTVVDFYNQKYGLVGSKVGVGLSLGGLLVARASSLDETLFDKVILYNYFPSMLDSFKKSMPKLLHPYIDKGFPSILEKFCSFYISKNKFLNWQIEHAKWTFGENSLNGLLAKCANFNEDIPLKQLNTDTLIFLGEKENYYDYQLGIDFYNSIPAKNKKLIVFNKSNFSSDLHCQNGASYESNEQLFEWLNTFS